MTGLLTPRPVRPVRLFRDIIRVDRPAVMNVARLDLATTEPVTEMNRTGITLDTAELGRMDRELSLAYDVALADLRKTVGDPEFNPASFIQVGKLLYDDMGLVPKTGSRQTKSGQLSTDDMALSGMAQLTDETRAIIGHTADLDKGTPGRGILECRRLSKLRGTYTGPLGIRTLVSADGRLRPTFGKTKARTGRMNSWGPNAQNIPPVVRKVFKAGKDRVLVSHDLSQIEMIWTAELSQDPTMIDIFNAGHDMHVKTACAIFRRDYAEVRRLWKLYKDKKNPLSKSDPVFIDMRDFELNCRLPSKTIGFAVVYGTQAAGLQGQIIKNGGPYLDVDTVQSYIDGWFDVYGGVREWLQLQVWRAMTYGMVWSGFGRVRYIPESGSTIRRIRSAGNRQTGNTPVQGTAGDHLKLGFAQLYHEYIVPYWSRLGYCKVLLQVHDELVTEIDESMADEYCAETQMLLENCVRPMSMAPKSSYSKSDNWGGLK